MFKGGDHAILWKPKLRIADIYENPDNQRAFGRMLDTCVCCNEKSPASDVGATLQYRNRQRLQCAHRDQGEARPMGAISGDKEGHACIPAAR